MIKQLKEIFNLVSDCIYLDHPIVIDIRRLFHTRLNKAPTDYEEWFTLVTRHCEYTLIDFIGMLLKDCHFRARIIKVLKEEKERLLDEANRTV